MFVILAMNIVGMRNKNYPLNLLPAFTGFIAQQFRLTLFTNKTKK